MIAAPCRWASAWAAMGTLAALASVSFSTTMYCPRIASGDFRNLPAAIAATDLSSADSCALAVRAMQVNARTIFF